MAAGSDFSDRKTTVYTYTASLGEGLAQPCSHQPQLARRSILDCWTAPRILGTLPLQFLLFTVPAFCSLFQPGTLSEVRIVARADICPSQVMQDTELKRELEKTLKLFLFGAVSLVEHTRQASSLSLKCSDNKTCLRFLTFIVTGM